MSSIYDPAGSGETGTNKAGTDRTSTVGASAYEVGAYEAGAYDEPMTGPLDPEQRRGTLAEGRHPVNITQLVMGVAFAGFLVVWALVVGDVVDGDDDRWLWPIPWLVAGAVGLAATVLPSRR